MRIDDPTRPKIAERPALASGLAAVPRLSLFWTSEGWELTVWVLITPNYAKSFSRFGLRPEDIAGIAKLWEEDPEQTLEVVFGASGASGANPTLAPTPTLRPEDLR